MAGAEPYGLLALAGIPTFKRILQQRADLERYRVEARALGYSVRDADMVLFGITHMAEQVAWSVDVFEQARRLLVSGKVPPP